MWCGGLTSDLSACPCFLPLPALVSAQDSSSLHVPQAELHRGARFPASLASHVRVRFLIRARKEINKTVGGDRVRLGLYCRQDGWDNWVDTRKEAGLVKTWRSIFQAEWTVKDARVSRA